MSYPNFQPKGNECCSCGQSPPTPIENALTRRALTLGADYTYNATQEEAAVARPAHNEQKWISVHASISEGMPVDIVVAQGDFWVGIFPTNVSLYGPLTATPNRSDFNVLLTNQGSQPATDTTPAMVVALYDVEDDNGVKVAGLRLEMAPGYQYWGGNWHRFSAIGWRLILTESTGTLWLDSFLVNLSWPAYEADGFADTINFSFMQPVSVLDDFTLQADFDGSEFISILLGEGELHGTVELSFSKHSKAVRLNYYLDDDNIITESDNMAGLVAWTIGSVGLSVPATWAGNTISIRLEYEPPDFVSLFESGLVDPFDLMNFVLSLILSNLEPELMIKTAVQS